MSEPCPECKGKCCRDDLGYRVAHYGAELYAHVCEACLDGDKYVLARTVDEERQDVVAWLRRATDPEYEVITLRFARDIEQGAHEGWAKKDKA